MRDAQLQIPDDWSGEWDCIRLQWPKSPKWYGVLLGELSRFWRGRTWDAESGTITDAQAVGAEIWERNYPLENCMSESLMGELIAAQGNKIATELRDWYETGGLSRVAPDAPDTTFNLDSGDTTFAERGARNAALCEACDRYARTMFEMTAARVRAAGEATAAAGAILGVVFPVAGAAIALAGISVSLLGEALNSGDAVESVICCFHSSLVNQTVSFANFAATPNSCGFTFPSNEAQLAGLLRNCNQDENNFILFMRELAAAYRRALLANIVTSDCLCDGPCLDTWDFENDGRGGWYLWPTLPYGKFDNTIGWKSTTDSSGNTRMYLNKNCEEQTTVTSWTVDVTNTHPTTQNNALFFALYDETNTETWSAAVGLAPGRQTIAPTGAARSAWRLALEVRSNPTPVISQIQIHSVEIS
jgi:hypothetical protein